MRWKFLIFLVYFLSLATFVSAQNHNQPFQLKPNKEYFLRKSPTLSTPRDTSSLKEEIEILRKELTALSQYVERKDEKITVLTDQLVELSLKLSEKEQLLEENTRQLIALSGQLTDIQSRLELGERIIEEKDKEIHLLATTQPQEVSSLDGKEDIKPLVTVYQHKLKEANRLLQEKIIQLNTLSNELAAWQDKFKEEELLSQNKTREIAALKRTIDHLRWKAMDSDKYLKNQLSSKDKELYELQGILNIYKEKLKQMNGLIQDKVSVLNELVVLEDQLVTAQNQFFKLKD